MKLTIYPKFGADPSLSMEAPHIDMRISIHEEHGGIVRVQAEGKEQAGAKTVLWSLAINDPSHYVLLNS